MHRTKHSLIWIACLLLFGAAILSLPGRAATRKHPHYIFLLPDGYVGWIRIVFGDRAAPELPAFRSGYALDIPDSGVTRTSALRVNSPQTEDEFLYKSKGGGNVLTPIPANFTVHGLGHGGIEESNAELGEDGYSWFLFIGPPEQRAQALADLEQRSAKLREKYGPDIAAPFPDPGRWTH